MTKTNNESVSELARFLTTPNAFRLLKHLSGHPEGQDLNQLAEQLHIKKAVVLAILDEGWELGVIEPVSVLLDPAATSNDSTTNHATEVRAGSDLPNNDSLFLGSSPLLREIPLTDFLERQAFLLTASRKINELNISEEPELATMDLSMVSPLIKTALEQRMKAGTSTLFHLTPWAQDLLAQVSTVEEMTEQLKERGLIK